MLEHISAANWNGPLRDSMSVPQTRSAPSPRAPGLPGSRLNLAQVGQARLALGEGWGGGWCGDARALPHRRTPTPNTSPQGGGEHTEFVERQNARAVMIAATPASRVSRTLLFCLQRSHPLARYRVWPALRSSRWCCSWRRRRSRRKAIPVRHRRRHLHRPIRARHLRLLRLIPRPPKHHPPTRSPPRHPHPPVPGARICASPCA